MSFVGVNCQTFSCFSKAKSQRTIRGAEEELCTTWFFASVLAMTQRNDNCNVCIKRGAVLRRRGVGFVCSGVSAPCLQARSQLVMHLHP